MSIYSCVYSRFFEKCTRTRGIILHSRTDKHSNLFLLVLRELVKYLSESISAEFGADTLIGLVEE